MNFKELSHILHIYNPIHFILNSNYETVVISNNCKKIFDFDTTIKENILKHIPQLIHDNSNKPYLITTLQGKKFTVKYESIKVNLFNHTLVSLHELSLSNNPSLKLHCLEEIINNINDGIIISDSNGKIITYNSSQEKLENLSSKDIIGKTLWEAYNYNSIELSEHQKVFHTGKAIVKNFKAHSHKDGIAKYLSYSTYPIRKDGEIIAIYSVSKNETTLKKLLAETIELKRKLHKYDTYKKKDFQNGTRFSFSNIIGDSIITSQIVSDAQNMALIENNLLIIGETGTGKEVFAQSIHNFGRNKKEPFVAINCGAIPENLLESILFGTVKGSYTGALDQIGLFEEAKNGTLFLDELNSMPISMQSKLLRVLQEREIRPVGSQKTIPINCRIISAVNEDPKKIISNGKLRQDLFYRIAGLCLYIPPLREKLEDISSLSNYFINQSNHILDKNIVSLSHTLKDIFYEYNWPGNVRELEYVIENLMIRALDSDKELRIEHMPAYTKSTLLSSKATKTIQHKSGSLTDALKDVEKKMILEQLNKNEWNISQSARDLGIIRQSLIYRIKKLNIVKPS